MNIKVGLDLLRDISQYIPMQIPTPTSAYSQTLNDSLPRSNPRTSKLSNNAYETSDQEQKLYTFYLDIVLNQNVELPKTQIYIPISYTVEHAIQVALQQFQRDLMMQCVIIEQQVDDFVPRLAKKSGKCKYDCPVIDKECILSELHLDTISLQVTNKLSVVIDKSRKRRSSLEEGEYQEIGYQKRRSEKIPGEDEAEKPPSTCFYSFC